MPDLQREFLDWLVDPLKAGSQTDWANEHSVHPRTVKSWKADPRFRQEWESRASEHNISFDRIQDMVETIYQAGKTDFKAAEMYLKYIERYLPPPERQTNDKTIREMSDEELDEMLDSLR
jgi:hypothetical protein